MNRKVQKLLEAAFIGLLVFMFLTYALGALMDGWIQEIFTHEQYVLRHLYPNLTNYTQQMGQFSTILAFIGLGVGFSKCMGCTLAFNYSRCCLPGPGKLYQGLYFVLLIFLLNGFWVASFPSWEIVYTHGLWTPALLKYFTQASPSALATLILVGFLMSTYSDTMPLRKRVLIGILAAIVAVTVMWLFVLFIITPITLAQGSYFGDNPYLYAEFLKSSSAVNKIMTIFLSLTGACLMYEYLKALFPGKITLPKKLLLVALFMLMGDLLISAHSLQFLFAGFTWESSLLKQLKSWGILFPAYLVTIWTWEKLKNRKPLKTK
ncbi:MAG: hypothetical protein HON43_06340 [Alphaproteobacteria bacterium]|jgi:hypothetical protein|nr:hypothetical protein [Alphaproteobacteria bacterium]MBT5389113.1 hypothetical protein [Alphaproteobacteria bacterium]MBT5541048.1 hypothetical protein [Alphaproteobacteria bacterium]